MRDTPRDVFAETVKKMFTSYDGFISGYDNDLGNWPDDISEYDHNELYALLCAWLTNMGENLDELDFNVYEHGALYEAASEAVNGGAIDDTLSPELMKLAETAARWRENDSKRRAHEERQQSLPLKQKEN